MEALQKYLLAFSQKKLRIDKAHGIAPHKPILLLSVLQTFQSQINKEKRIFISPELVSFFKTNWSSLVTSDHECRFALPFYHLTSDLFWKLIPKPGFENLLQLKSSMRSFANLNAAVEYAEIEEDLYELAIDKSTNQILQQFLLEEYFPSTKNNLKNVFIKQKELFNDIENKILRESSNEYRTETKSLIKQQNDEEVFIRGSLFKREVPKIYNNTCCISGMRVDAIINVSMVDACHIVPFSESYDDTISNGIALCPNLHRAFDRGLISIDNDFRVLVKSDWKETETNYSIKQFEKKQIKLPKLKANYPSSDNFKSHRIRFNF